MTENKAKSIDDCLKELKGHRDEYLKRSTPWRIINRAVHLVEELKAYRAIGTIEELKAIKSDGGFTDDLLNMGYTKGIKDGYNKAIDEFAKEIEAEYDNDACPNVTDYLDYKISIRDLFRIAEQMKGE